MATRETQINHDLKTLLRRAEKVQRKRLTKERRMVNRALKGGNKSDIEDLMSRLKTMAFEPVFCEADYASGDGFQTSVWGPPTWTMLHIFSLNYTRNRKEGYQLLLNGLKRTLPCKHCRDNFEKNYQCAKAVMRRKYGIADIWESRASFSRFCGISPLECDAAQRYTG